MMLVQFKNLDSSEFIQRALAERIAGLEEKFPDFEKCNSRLTVEMLNSPRQSGPDQYRIKLFVASGRYRSLTIEKRNLDVYVALAELTDDLLERLNRFGDKIRVKNRRQQRKLQQKFQKLSA